MNDINHLFRSTTRQLVYSIIDGLVGKEILANELTSEKAPDDNMTLEDDLRLDYLDRIMICRKLEEGLKIDIPNDSIKEFNTVNDIIECVESLVK